MENKDISELDYDFFLEQKNLRKLQLIINPITEEQRMLRTVHNSPTGFTPDFLPRDSLIGVGSLDDGGLSTIAEEDDDANMNIEDQVCVTEGQEVS